MSSLPTIPAPRLGVFDSGVGGLTVLRELRQQLPKVAMHYVADTAHAPYGLREADYIIERSLKVAGHLIDQGARVLVVACNTATAHAIAALRQRWPEVPIVGTEPGIKPAVAQSRVGRIGVMATPATIASARFADLVQKHAGSVQVFSQACPGLVELIERGDLQTEELRALLAQLCQPLIEAEVDTVLMGCTHYPLIQTQLQETLGPQVKLLNIEFAVAQQAARQWQALGLSTEGPECQPLLQTSGDAETLRRFVKQALAWQTLPSTLKL